MIDFASVFDSLLNVHGETATVDGQAITVIVNKTGGSHIDAGVGLVIHEMSVMVAKTVISDPDLQSEIVIRGETYRMSPRSEWRNRSAWWEIPLYRDEVSI